MKSIRLPRRTFLRGALGVAVGLPVLECMLDSNGNLGNARAQAAGIPRRYAVIFAGMAIGADGTQRNQFRINGNVIHEDGHFIVPGRTQGDGSFVPDPAGPLSAYPVVRPANGLPLPTPLLPLKDLLGDFSLVSGLNIPRDAPLGAFPDFHGGGCSPLISGTRSTTSNFTANGPTSDQIIAQLNAGQTTIPSLVLRSQPAFYVNGFGFSNREFISYSGAGQRIDAQTNPRTQWTSLFSTFVPDDQGAAAIQDFTQRKRLSVLDLVTGKRQKLLGKVGAADKIRLDQHFTELAALETRIRALPPPQNGTCAPLADPGDPPPVGGDNNGSGFDPADPNNQIQQNTGYSGEDEISRVFCDLIHMSFVCDLTRAASLQITAFQCHMNSLPLMPSIATLLNRNDINIRADVHENGHNGDPENKGQLHVSAILAWHISHYAYLMQKLKDTPEGAGNCLDNSCIVFMPEAGHGTQLNDGSSPFATHSVEDMILLVGGRAGGMSPGRYIPNGGNVHPAQVLLAALQHCGYQSNTFGDVTGAFSGL